MKIQFNPNCNFPDKMESQYIDHRIVRIGKLCSNLIDSGNENCIHKVTLQSPNKILIEIAMSKSEIQNLYKLKNLKEDKLVTHLKSHYIESENDGRSNSSGSHEQFFFLV